MDLSGGVDVWVLEHAVREGTHERLGDARRVADELGGRVGLLFVGPEAPDPQPLFTSGADHVGIAYGEGVEPRVRAALEWSERATPRLVIAPGDCRGRQWAARLAVRAGWTLFSPALMEEVRGGSLWVSALDRTGRWTRREQLGSDEPAIVTLRDGVAEASPPHPERAGTTERLDVNPPAEPVVLERHIPADPRTIDIRYANRLVSGGRGLGSKEGFELLQRFADLIGAGVAASRMAVDLGWIAYERQVGQTGKTVKPYLYIACGISGASHHIEGMSETEHIIAINIDPEAPIFDIAHLGLVADLYGVLEHAEERLSAS